MDRLEVKAAITVSDAGEITGTAWPFGSPDRVGDVIEKGAFSAPATLPMLFAHDHAQPIGVWNEITETDAGLTVKGKLLIDEVQRAREVRAMIREKAVTGLSIGFVAKSAKPRQRGRTISALELHEISVVAVPCHPGATITSMKAATDGTATAKEMNMDPEIENAPAVEQKADPVIDQKSFDAMKARLDKLEAKSNRPIASNNNHPSAVNDNEETKAFYDYLRTGRADEKALAYAPPSTGGILAPEEVSKTIIERVTEFSPVRALASSIRMSGALMQLPRLVDDVVIGEVTETSVRPEDEPTFEQIDLKPFEMSVIVPVTRIMLEDAHINLEAYLRNYLGKRYGEKESGWFINGNGTTQAEGVLTSDEVGEFDAAGTAITADDLIDTFYSIKTAYSASGSWLMNRKTMAAVRKLKDTDGAYLWERGIAAGQPPLLLGRPVYEAPHMANPAAGAAPIVFGDFASGYMIADRIDFEFDTDGKSAWGTGIVKMLTRRRVGGRVVLGEALTKLKLAAA